MSKYTRSVTYYGEIINLTEEHFSYIMNCVRNGETTEQAMDRIRIEVDEGKQDFETLDYFICSYPGPVTGPGKCVR